MIRSTRLYVGLVGTALILLLQLPVVSAAPTGSFRVSTFVDLNKGEPLGTFISSKGEVIAGRDSKRLKSPSAAMVWSSAQDAAGTVYFGTGDEAAIWTVKKDDVRKLADLGGVLVTALAPGSKGKLLAAVMPQARIVEVDTGSGKWRQIAKLPTQHIWALLHDPKAGRIYAASGSPGRIYSLSEGGGKPEVYYDPGETHLLCLARDRGGALLAGASDSAILYRVTGKGKGMAVHDFDATEVRDVAVMPDGTLWLAVNKFPRHTTGLPRFDRSDDGEEGTSIKSSQSGKAAKSKAKVRPQELRPGARSGKGAIFAIDPNGRVDEVLTLDSGYLTRLAAEPNGVLWAADGTQGKVYLIYGDRTVVTAFDFPERQVLSLAVAGGYQYLGTGDAGAVYRLSAGAGSKPTYLSQVFDGKFDSTWGNLQYQASESIRMESRSGNTAKPNKTWSNWAPAKPAGRSLAKLRSPAARYLQLRMVWQGRKDGLLRSFSAYYQAQNQRARVTEIIVGEEKKDKDKDKDKDKRAAKLKIKWKTENPDGDSLVYRLYYREELGVSWRPIGGPEPLEKAEYDWDTEPIPDGYYRIKVVASDEKDNPEESTLTDSEISERILIDNRKPEVVGLAVKRPWVSGMARDSYSTLKRVEYSLDGGPWRVVRALDGIYDSPAEAFRFKLPDNLHVGVHVVAVRALDEADNMGVSQVRFVR